MNFNNSDNPIVKALVASAYHIGVTEIDPVHGACVRGEYVDGNLAVLVLAERIAAGDVMVVEKGDSLGKKEYFNRLLKNCKNLDISSYTQKK